MLIYINGTFYTKEDARVSVLDHGLLYGDGVFETVHVYKQKSFKLDEHLERLSRSANALHLTVPLPKADLKKAVERTIALNKYGDAALRIIITRGVGEIGLTTQCTPTIIIIADKFMPKDPTIYQQGVKIITVNQERGLVGVKTLNYLPNILAHQKAKSAGAYDAVFLTPNQEVTEGTTSNLFIVKNKVVVTPSDVLEGITRQVVLELAEAAYTTEIRPVLRAEMYNADECFLTSTLSEIIPVVKVDQVIIKTGKPGPVTQTLMQRFRQAVESLCLH